MTHLNQEQWAVARSADPNLTSGGASDTRYEIAVDFVLSGDAVRGTDYDLLCGQSVVTSNTVSIPEDETSVSLAIRPKNDHAKEDDMPATLTITGARSSGVFDSGGSGCSCACWGAGGNFPIQPNGNTATVTIVDDDHWLLSVVANDNVATERMSDLDADNNPDTDEQDPAEFTFSRGGTRSGDVTYPVEVTFTITETTHPAVSATPFDDYFFIVTDVHGGGATYLDEFTYVGAAAPSTDPTTGETTVVHTFTGEIPADATSAKLKIQPNFDWEDEGALFDPNGGGSPAGQSGETINLAITDVDWDGLNVPGVTRIGNPSAASAEIRDGAILEVYLDYTRDGTFDARLSVDDVPCFMPLNEDDDNRNYASDKDEYPGHPADYAGVTGEDELVSAAAFAWIEQHGQFNFDVRLNSPQGAVKLWTDSQKNALLLDPGPLSIGILGTAAYESFWIEGMSIGQSSVSVNAQRYKGTEPAPGCDGTDTATLIPGFDLDMDSDNNGLVESSSVEEFLEDHEYALGTMLNYNAETQAILDAAKNGESYATNWFGEPVLLRFPPGLDPTDDSLQISFSFIAAYISLWMPASGGSQAYVQEVDPSQGPFTLADLGYDPGTGVILLYICAECDTTVKTYMDTKAYVRPTYPLEAELTVSYEQDGVTMPGYTLEDTVQYITAPVGTFYRELNSNAVLRHSLAAKVVYGDPPAPIRYCLEPQDADLLQKLGFDPGVAADGLDPDAEDGYQAVLYRDFCDLQYVLAFAGTDFSQLADLAQNFANGSGVSAAQMFKAVSIASYISGDRSVTLDQRGVAEENKLKNHVRIVGHSLGGALASGAAVASNMNAETFNSAGLTRQVLNSVCSEFGYTGYDPNWVTELASRIATLNTSRIVRFANKWDLLTLMQKHIDLMPEAIGHDVTINGKSSIILASQYDSDIEAPFPGLGSNGERLISELINLNATLNGDLSLLHGVISAILTLAYASDPAEVHKMDQVVFGILEIYGKESFYGE